MLNKAMKFTKQHQQYQSEFSQFINDFKKKNPEIELKQQIGRALLWDKTPIDLDTQRRFSESRIKQEAYVYQHPGQRTKKNKE
jgi:aspartate ammonia-lyase